MGAKEKLTFDGDYDFDKANEEFQEVLSKLNKTKIDDGTASPQENGDHVPAEGEEKQELEDGEVQETEGYEEEEKAEENYYNKETSFFDKISCEALERSKGRMRNDWRAEKKLNKPLAWQETVGTIMPEEEVMVTETEVKVMEVDLTEDSAVDQATDVGTVPEVDTTVTTEKVDMEADEEDTMEEEAEEVKGTRQQPEVDQVHDVHNGLVNETSNMKQPAQPMNETKEKKRIRFVDNEH